MSTIWFHFCLDTRCYLQLFKSVANLSTVAIVPDPLPSNHKASHIHMLAAWLMLYKPTYLIVVTLGTSWGCLYLSLSHFPWISRVSSNNLHTFPSLPSHVNHLSLPWYQSSHNRLGGSSLLFLCYPFIISSSSSFLPSFQSLPSFLKIRQVLTTKHDVFLVISTFSLIWPQVRNSLTVTTLFTPLKSSSELKHHSIFSWV